MWMDNNAAVTCYGKDDPYLLKIGSLQPRPVHVRLLSWLKKNNMADTELIGMGKTVSTKQLWETRS